jgi:peroxiredoxin
MLNHRLVALGAICLVTPAVVGQVDPQARRVLEGMASAVEEARAITYQVEVQGEGVFFGVAPRLTGEVAMLRRGTGEANKLGPWHVRVVGQSEAAEDVPAQHFTVIDDGQRFSWINHEHKQLIYRHRSAARGNPTDNAKTLQIPYLSDSGGFQRELSMPTIEMVGQETIADEVCDVVYVDEGENQWKRRWAIARSDGIPRRVEVIMRGGILNDRRTWKITNVQVDPELDDALFTLVAPEGYTTIGAPIVARPGPVEAFTHTDADETGTVAAPQGPVVRVVGTDVGNLAPDFDLSNAAGERVRLSDQRGGVVLLDFWGTWCLPCRHSSPEVQKVFNDYQQRGVKVFGLAVRERNDENPINYMRDNKYTYTLLLRADDVAKQYRVRSYPTFMVIGREGEIVHLEAGFDPDGSFPRIREAIDRALAGEAMAPGGDRPVHLGGEGLTVTRDGETAASEGEKPR